MNLPPVSSIRCFDTHRLVAAKYSDDSSGVLGRVAGDSTSLRALAELESITDERLLGEHDLLPGIGVQELVFGVPHAHLINAAFTYAHPFGGRFNGPDRGCWYAAFAIETSQAEVAFHKTIHLAEIGVFEDEVLCVDYLADFAGEFHDLRGNSNFNDCFAPHSYVKSQALAEGLSLAASLGPVYPSVRHTSGTCLACFRPALVSNVRRGRHYRFTWARETTPVITEG